MADRAGPELGDQFVTGDDIRAGDLVYWDCGPGGECLLRRLDEWLLDARDGPVYRVESGPDGPLSLMFIEVKARREPAA